jgi:alpha-tubulin suppressor-like RCC1 family protein
LILVDTNAWIQHLRRNDPRLERFLLQERVYTCDVVIGELLLGSYHGCAALSGGGVECWQTDATNGNIAGQLGNGTTTASTALYRATPVLTAAATPLTNVVAVALGYASNNACAVTSTRNLWCWGNLTWLVNNGTTLDTGYAQEITTDGATPFTGVKSAGLGAASACAILSGTPNTVSCWGYNGYAQLGLGNTTNEQYPTPVLGLTSPTKLAITSQNTTSATDTVCVMDGSNVRCWGYNGDGQAGSNTTTNPILSPTAVVVQSGALLGEVLDLQTGSAEFAVLRSGNTIWGWGDALPTNGDIQIYAANYNVTNVVALGWAGPPISNGPRYITSDAVYHNAMTTFTVDCNK